VLRHSNTSSSDGDSRSESIENVSVSGLYRSGRSGVLVSIQIPATVHVAQLVGHTSEHMGWVLTSELIPTMAGGEKERRSMEKTVARAASHLKANNLLNTKQLMVPNDVSTEVHKRGLKLHETLCSASHGHHIGGDRRKEGTGQEKGYSVAEPHFSVVPIYRGVNERPLEFDDHQPEQSHRGGGTAFAGQWPLLSPIVRVEPSHVQRIMKTPVKGAIPTPSPNEVYSTPPSRPISSTPVRNGGVGQRGNSNDGEVPVTVGRDQ